MSYLVLPYFMDWSRFSVDIYNINITELYVSVSNKKKSKLNNVL